MNDKVKEETADEAHPISSRERGRERERERAEKRGEGGMGGESEMEKDFKELRERESKRNHICTTITY